MGRETKEVGAMPTCYCLTFVCCKPCLPNFQFFQSCVSWTPFCIFSFCYFSYAVVSGTYPWMYLRQIKSDYHGWLSTMTSSEGPSFLSCLGPPNPKPTTAHFPPPMNTRGWQTLKQRTSYSYFHLLSNFNTVVGRKWRRFDNRFWSKWRKTSDGDAQWRTKACKLFWPGYCIE